jgi:hypothetical protein
MLKWSLNSDDIAEEMERQAVKAEAKVRRLLGRNGLTLSSEGKEALHGAVMEAVSAKVEAEGALKFLEDLRG